MSGVASTLGVFVLLVCTMKTQSVSSKDVMSQPYGFQMCRAFCQRLVGCRTFIYRASELCCEYKTYVHPTIGNIHAVLKLNYGLANCQSLSMVILTRSHGFYCHKSIKTRRRDRHPHKASGVACKKLFECIRKGFFASIRAILSRGRSYRHCKDENGMNSVMVAAIEGERKIVNHLIKLGHDVKASTARNKNALHFAIQYGHLDIVKGLLKIFGLDHDPYLGGTPCTIASYYKKIKVLEYLVKAGCNLAATDRNNNTVLHHACSSGSISFFQRFYLLFKSKIDFNARGKNNKTCFMMAGETKNPYFITNVQQLIVGLEIGAQKKFGSNLNLKSRLNTFF